MPGKIGYNPTVADATLTASTQALTYEVFYIHDGSPANKWRTTSITTQSLLIDHGSAKTIKALYIDGSNMVSGDTTYTIQAGSAPAATDFGPINLTKDTKSYLEITGQTWRYWLLKATKASGTYIEWGLIELYQDLDEFDKNYNIDRSTGSIKVFSTKKGRRGQIVRSFLYRAETRNWTFTNITEAQRALFDQTYGVLESCILYDDQMDKAYYGIVDISPQDIDRCEKFGLTLLFTEKK